MSLGVFAVPLAIRRNRFRGLPDNPSGTFGTSFDEGVQPYVWAEPAVPVADCRAGVTGSVCAPAGMNGDIYVRCRDNAGTSGQYMKP
jgi:hypothetical protein